MASVLFFTKAVKMLKPAIALSSSQVLGGTTFIKVSIETHLPKCFI